MSKLVRQSLRILLGRGVVSGFSVLVTIYFAYELPKNIFAFLALYATASALSRTIADLGLSTMIMREVPALLKTNLQAAMESAVLPGLVLRTTASIILCLITVCALMLATVPLEREFPDLNIRLIAVVASLAMLVENWTVIVQPLFHVQGRFGTDSFLTSFSSFLESMFGLVAIAFFNVEFYFVGILIAQSIVLVVRVVLLRNLLSGLILNRLRWSVCKTMLTDYFPLYVRRFFRFGMLQGEQLIIVVLLPLNQLANFNLAKKLSKYFKFYTEAFVNPLALRISKSKDPEARHKSVRTTLWFTIPPPIILSLLSPWIMEIAGGQQYKDSWFILAILYFSYVFYALSAVQFAVVGMLGKQTDSLYRDMIGGTIGLLSTILLIIYFNEYGLAWGQVIAYLALYVVGYKITKKYLQSGFPGESRQTSFLTRDS